MKVGIVGGGVAGLTAAYRLLQQGHEAHVYEAAPGWGGLVRNFQVSGEPLECFYHHIFTTDTTIIALIQELGLGDRLTWRDSKVGVFVNGRIYNFVTPLDLLRFTPLGFRDRLRLGLMGLYLRRQKDARRYENVTAKDWITRFAGRRNWDVVWGPLFRGKFGDMSDRIVMTWLWNKIRVRFASRRAGPLQKEVLGYALGSFGVYIEELVERIRALGGGLHASTPVQRIVIENGRAAGLAFQNGQGVLDLDAIIATVAGKTFVRIAPDLPADYKALCEAVPYQDALCLVLTLRRPLTHVYWLNISDDTVPFLALVEHTNFIEPERYDGQHVLYISNYLAKESPLLSMDEDEVWDLYSPHLRKINPDFDESWVIERRLFRAADAQPVFTVDNARRIPDHRTPTSGLYLANMSQIYPEDRGQNYSIRLGEEIARLVMEDAAEQPG